MKILSCGAGMQSSALHLMYEAFGVTPQEVTGGQVQEPAEPAQEPITQPAEGAPAEQTHPETQDPPAEQPEGEGDQTSLPREGGEHKDGAQTPPLTEQQRRENAARRRHEEAEAAIGAAVQEALRSERERADSEMAAFFAAANLKNTITGEPITNMEQFKAWKEAFDAAQLQKNLKAGKLTPEDLQKVVSQTPAVQQAQQLLEERDAARRKADMDAAQRRVETEIAEIGKMDPAIKTVQDLLKMPKAKEFYDYVKKGNSFLDAYYLSHREEIAARQTQAARQQAQNLTRSKEHLTATGVRGDGSAAVPAEDMAMFREFNPGATEAEIQAYYNKYKNG